PRIRTSLDSVNSCHATSSVIRRRAHSSLSQRAGGTLSWAPSADAVAGGGDMGTYPNKSRDPALARMQQVGQCRDVRDVAKVVDDLQARFDLPLMQLRPRHQRAVFGIDIGPGNATDAGSFRGVDSVREGPAVLCPNGHRRTLLILLDIFGGWRTNANLV